MPRRPPPGPRLKPGLRCLWRGPDQVQVGLQDGRAVLLAGLGDQDCLVLQALGGTVPRVPTGPPVAGPPGAGAREAPPDGGRVLDLLAGAGLLVTRPTPAARTAVLGAARARLQQDAEVWSLAGGEDDGWPRLLDRRRRSVAVCGTGRTASALADRLREAGVGRVHNNPDRLGEPDRPGRQPSVEATAEADLVVLVDRDAADAVLAEQLVHRDQVHLSVVLCEDTAVVGPLVRPGSSPCLRCLDLHRADADPQWPRVLAQLLTGRPAPDVSATPEEGTLAQLTAALAALQILAHLDAEHATAPDPGDGSERSRGGGTRPAALGATLQVTLPDGLVHRRSWPGHPDCGCHWPPATLSRADHQR